MVVPEAAMVELLRQAHDVVAKAASPASKRDDRMITEAEQPIAFRAVLEHLIRNEEQPAG